MIIFFLYYFYTCRNMFIAAEANAVWCISLFHTEVKCIMGKASRVRPFFCVCLFVCSLFVCCNFESELRGNLEKSKIAQSC